MRSTTLIKSLVMGLTVCGIMLAHGSFLMAQERTSAQEGQACGIEPSGGGGTGKHHSMIGVMPRMQKMQASKEEALGRYRIAQATEHAVEEKPTEPSQMSRYYLGRTVNAGPFSGRLVCLRCDTMPTPENVTFCETNGHRHALAMEGDTMIHPLLFENEKLFARVGSQDWYRKKVKVSGKYYADTGFILVSDITVENE